MKTVDVSQEKSESSNINSLSKIIGKAVFSTSFILSGTSLISYFLNDVSVLSYSEQLALMSHPKFAAVLSILVALIPLYRVLEEMLFNNSNNKSMFSSIWTPIKYASLSCLFIPFEQEHLMTSNAVQIMKYIVKTLSN